jgi:hypothetical protein
VLRHKPFVLRHEPLVLRHKSLVLRHEPFVLRHKSLVLRHEPSVFGFVLFDLVYDFFVVSCLTIGVGYSGYADNQTGV